MRILLSIVLCLFINGTAFAQKSGTIKITKKQTHVCVAALNGKWWDQTISKDSLLQIGHLELLGDCADSAKICQFEMAITTNGQTVLTTSNDKYFTKRMIELINQSTQNSVMAIQYVKYKLPNGLVLPTNGFWIHVTN